MSEILMTSSVLIVLLLILRQAFRKAIPCRVQYALWALVLVRLLVPVNLPAVDFSVLTAAQDVNTQVETQLENREVYVLPLDRTPADTIPAAQDVQPGETVPTAESFGYPVLSDDGQTVTRYADKWTLSQVLTAVWAVGAAAAGIFFLAVNLRFWRKLCKARIPYSVSDCKFPVYLVEEGLPSPCLFGLFRPAIYLTPAAAEPERLHHVLLHEQTHARQGDLIWSALRCVCLALYWFDPLVWAAAAASRTDCELACDERVLRNLGQEERLAYGRTLLALIPVRRAPGTALLSATTMTSGKRRLKDRITRIAKSRQTAWAAVVLLAAVVTVVCAVTFTGARDRSAESHSLTGDELTYFNTEFFNGDTGNFHNQFLSCLYESPADIDLFDLLYDGVPEEFAQTQPSEAELRQALGDPLQEGRQYCRLTAAELSTLLLDYTGLTLEETNQTDLDAFTYVPGEDAYYWTTDPTNSAPPTVTFTAGEQDGDLVRLYYQDFRFGGYGSFCVTLRAQPDGSYWFVSHLIADSAAVPTAFPEGDPVLTIPLTGLIPYQPETLAVTRHTGDLAETPPDVWTVYDASFAVYRSTDGSLYAAVAYDTGKDDLGVTAWDVGCFFTFPEETQDEEVTLSDFYDLFGCSGVSITYPDHDSNRTVHDYYTLSDSGDPMRLARVYGTAAAVDLDGDGTEELVASEQSDAQLIFQRDGALYEVDLAQRLLSAWPDMQYQSFDFWDPASRCLPMGAQVPLNAQSGTIVTARRWIYFDGETLRLYTDPTVYTDHVAQSIDVPEAVLEAAKAQALTALEYWQTHTGQQSTGPDGQLQDTGSQAQWDDWRITDLSPVPLTEDHTGIHVVAYHLECELHTTTPERVALAGGMYLLEDGWMGGDNTIPAYLFFTVDPNDGSLTFLPCTLANDEGPDSPMFYAKLSLALLDAGYLVPSVMPPEDLYHLFYVQPAQLLNNLSRYDDWEQTAAVENLVNYAASGAAGEDAGLWEDGLARLEEAQSELTAGGAALREQLLALAGRSTQKAPSAPPTDTQLHSAILEHRQSAVSHTFDYIAEAHRILDQRDGGNTYTFDLQIVSYSYTVQDGSWTADTGGSFPASLTFTYQNGGWVLTDYWEPAGGGAYASEIRSRFSDKAAQAILSEEAAAWEADLKAQCDDAAVRYFAQTTGQVPAKTFTPADVEFTGQALTVSPDSMSYEERLAWAQNSEWDPEGAGFQFLPFAYTEGEGCIACAGSWAGTPHMEQNALMIRFADGTQADLPLPQSYAMGVARPDSMTFSGGTFVYTVVFSDQLLDNEGQSLLHLAGTYRYTVDLTAKTISLTVEQP